ncbi:MAG: hypothetical protein J4428_05270 [Candidatus Aenigmarchaeota archaeon]|nr:hypothetical protein [Candidatus Aenigmarchaeota archaeon]
MSEIANYLLAGYVVFNLGWYALKGAYLISGIPRTGEESNRYFWLPVPFDIIGAGLENRRRQT